MSLIDKFHDIMSSNTHPLSDCSILVTNIDIRRIIDRSELGFLDRGKINGILNGDLPLILEITIVDHNLTEFLVDDISSCNILYSYTMDLISIRQEYLSLYGIKNLLAFNDSITHPQGDVALAMSVGEEYRERKVIRNFLKISC